MSFLINLSTIAAHRYVVKSVDEKFNHLGRILTKNENECIACMRLLSHDALTVKLGHEVRVSLKDVLDDTTKQRSNASDTSLQRKVSVLKRPNSVNWLEQCFGAPHGGDLSTSATGHALFLW